MLARTSSKDKKIASTTSLWLLAAAEDWHYPFTWFGKLLREETMRNTIEAMQETCEGVRA